MNKSAQRIGKFLLVNTLVIWAVFFLSYWSGGFFKRDGHIWAKSLGTWGDGAVHLTYINAMAERIPNQLPMYAGKRFVYPFLADGLAAVLVRFGLSSFSAYNSVGAVLSLLFLAMLTMFYQKVFKNIWITLLGIQLFLLSGGLGFIKFFQDFNRTGIQAVKAIPQEYTLIEEWKVRWINIVTAELIPQRAFLLAIPIGLFICLWWWKIHTDKEPSWTETALVAILTGIMPITHAHTYIFIGIHSVVLTLFAVFEKKKYWNHILVYGFVSALLSLPLLLFHILPNADGSFFKVYIGWLAKTYETNWLWWWFVNTGLFWPLVGVGLFGITKIQRRYLVSGIVAFILSNLVLFQPYDWDNSKVITWTMLLFSPVVAVALISLWKRHWTLRGVVVVLFVSLTLSGFLDVVRQLQPHVNVRMYGIEELLVANWVKENTDKNAVFITGHYSTHPIPSLAGRQIGLGYQGWVWSYGISYWERERLIKEFFEKGDLTVVKDLDADYFVIGPDERSRYTILDSLDTKYRAVYRSQNYSIYTF